jgi:hypothetical protein
MTRKSVVITLQMSLKICKAKHVRVPKYVHKIVKHVVQFLFTEEDSALKKPDDLFSLLGKPCCGKP